LEFKYDSNVIVGIETSDDAGVYRISDDTALVQTLDFITAIGDGDPYTFGQIAAANSLSDVWAMGGRPVTAMSIVCFPSEKLDISILRSIILGAIDKTNEAGVALVGGHSVRDNELKFGLSVTGLVHPDKVITNKSARLGDELVITKALGTGILNTAMKAGMLEADMIKETIKLMTRLNKTAGEAMTAIGASAATDITGFGLIGHVSEMAGASRVAVELEVENIPVLERVKEFSRMGVVPGKLYDNLNFYGCKVEGEIKKDEDWMSILNDPQTSGGMLIAVPEEKTEEMLSFLRERGNPEAAVIGRVTEGNAGHIYLK
jgi:selenide,water dikinase